MSRIDQAWRRTAPGSISSPDDAFAIEQYPTEGRIAPPRPAYRPDDDVVASAGPQVRVAPSLHRSVGLDSTPGLVEQCARLVDAVHARSHDSALTIVVVTTPVANAYAPQASVHVARLLSAGNGADVILVDASGGDPRLAAHFEFEVGSHGVGDLPSIQLVVLNAEHRALAGRLRAFAQDAGVRWVVAHAPAFADMPDHTALHAMVRLGDSVILVLPASTPTPVIGEAVAAVGRERLLGTVLVGVDGL